MNRTHAKLFSGTDTSELFLRAAHAGLGQMIGDFDSANAPVTAASGKTGTAGKRGRPAGKTAAKRGRPAGTGAKRGRPAGTGAKRGPKPKAAKTSKKKSYAGAKRGRKSNAELAKIAAKAKAARAKAKASKPAAAKRKPAAKAAAPVA